jgi:hypothetical protein
MPQSGHERTPRPAAAPRGGGAGRIVRLSKHERPEGRAVLGARPCVLMVAPQPFFRVTGSPINVLMMCRALTGHGFKVCLLTLPYGEDPALAGLVLQRVMRLPFADVPVGFSLAKVCYNLLLAGSLVRLLATRPFAASYTGSRRRRCMLPRSPVYSGWPRSRIWIRTSAGSWARTSLGSSGRSPGPPAGCVGARSAGPRACSRSPAT